MSASTADVALVSACPRDTPETVATRGPAQASRRRRAEHFVRRHPVVLPGLASTAVGVGYLLAPRMGQDLAAQMARADFARDFPTLPVDLRWFGGVLTFGYSAWTPAVMAVIGPRVTCVLATIAAVALLTVLLKRSGATRPILGGLVAAITLSSNLTEGRTTFACGVAAGLLALVCVTPGTASRTAARRTAIRLTGAALASLLAGLASPVAALFVGIAAAALLLRRHLTAALCLGVPAAASLLVTSVLFADGGRALVSTSDAVRALLATAAVIVLVPRRCAVLRLGAGIGFVMMAFAWAVPSPLGANGTRLTLLFMLPVVAAFVSPATWLPPVRTSTTAVTGLVVGLTLAVLAVVQPPLVFGTIARAGAPVSSASYFTPLADELRSRGVSGRVEVPELLGHWEAAYLARHVPLARGWLRQTDTKLNTGVFYDARPEAANYLRFLQRNAVQYVAVADAPATFAGRPEAALVRAGLPYLQPVWSDAHWQLYAVSDPTPVVSPPALLRSEQADRLVVSVPQPGDVVVRMRWWRWLSVQGPSGACVARRDAQSVTLHATRPGTYTLTSALSFSSAGCR